jgi:PEP-CTERM motif
MRNFEKGCLRRLALVSTTAALAAAGLGLGSSAYASTTLITFGQTSSGNVVTATGGVGSTTIDITDALANITQILGGSPISGVFVDLAAMSTDAATSIGPAVLQHYSGTFCVASGAGCTGTDYLSGSFTDAALGIGNQLSIVVGNPPDALTLMSDVIPADALGAPSALGFTFTNVTPAVHIGVATVASFTASFSGNASASPVPEPSTWAMMLAGFAGLGYAAFRRGWKSRPDSALA